LFIFGAGVVLFLAAPNTPHALADSPNTQAQQPAAIAGRSNQQGGQQLTQQSPSTAPSPNPNLSEDLSQDLPPLPMIGKKEPEESIFNHIPNLFSSILEHQH